MPPSTASEQTASHTPGPWCVDHDGFRIIGIGNGYPKIAYVDRPTDARLIAAAPEMLVALKYCEAMISEGAIPPDWDSIRATIAKAEGR